MINREPITEPELINLTQIGGFTIRELVNGKSQTLKKLRLDKSELNDGSASLLLQENPSIMVRPILTDGKKLLIGFREAEYDDFLGDTQ